VFGHSSIGFLLEALPSGSKKKTENSSQILKTEKGALIK